MWIVAVSDKVVDAVYPSAYGIRDGPDHVHTGFFVFLALIERFRPRHLLHGHRHVYGPEPTRTVRYNTQVINIHPYRIIEIDQNQT